MTVEWEKKPVCATECPRCGRSLNSKDQRILSPYDNEPICMVCNANEEQRPDYKAALGMTAKQCMVDVELMRGDPGGYCFHHFYPYEC